MCAESHLSRKIESSKFGLHVGFLARLSSSACHRRAPSPVACPLRLLPWLSKFAKVSLSVEAAVPPAAGTAAPGLAPPAQPPRLLQTGPDPGAVAAPAP